MAMSRRQIIFLVIAFAIAIMTVLAARSVMKPAPVQQQAVKQEAPTTQVLVARKDLPSGSFIGAGDVDWRNWPADAPTEGLIIKGKNAEADYTGAIVRTGMRAGEPVIGGRILKAGDHGFLAAVLSPGMRAMTIKISPVSGVAGFVFPNDHVDVILAHEIQREDDARLKDRRVSETVLEDVRVLALDQKTNDQQTEPKPAELATLEVTPKQAEKLALVSQMGTLSLVLRSIATTQTTEGVKKVEGNDTTGLDPKILEAARNAMPRDAQQPLATPNGVTWDSDVSVALPAPASKNELDHTIQIYRGSTATDVTFEGNR